MKFTSSFLYALALLFSMATARAQDCMSTTDNIKIDAQGSDGTIDGTVASVSYAVENNC